MRVEGVCGAIVSLEKSEYDNECLVIFGGVDEKESRIELGEFCSGCPIGAEYTSATK
jgi:hypothetical protein